MITSIGPIVAVLSEICQNILSTHSLQTLLYVLYISLLWCLCNLLGKLSASSDMKATSPLKAISCFRRQLSYRMQTRGFSCYDMSPAWAWGWPIFAQNSPLRCGELEVEGKHSGDFLVEYAYIKACTPPLGYYYICKKCSPPSLAWTFRSIGCWNWEIYFVSLFLQCKLSFC